MTVEEYEAVRLIDGEGLMQDECAELMDVARTTAQRIYGTARKKLADFLVHGKTLKIEGGDYTLRAPEETPSACGKCRGCGCAEGRGKEKKERLENENCRCKRRN